MRSRWVWLLGLLVTAGGTVAGCGGGGGGSDRPRTYTISGQVTGSVIFDVPVMLRGDGSDEAATRDLGEYDFQGLSPGTYAVVPELTGVRFLPPNRIVEIVDADVAGVDFVSEGARPPLNTDPPATTVRLVMVHDATGDNWLKSSDGLLGDGLGGNNYYVRDVSLGWDAPTVPENTDIGSRTDIGHWYTWFADTTPQSNLLPTRENICGDLYATNARFASYDETLVADPGGENEIVVILSGYRNSDVKNNDPGQPPQNLYGQFSSSAAHTLENCQDVYDQILEYFKSRPDKLFVVVTAPPRADDDPAALLTQALNARRLNDWLVDNWLQNADWERKNVAVFDFFNVLTHELNHHRVTGDVIEHITVDGNKNFTAPLYQSGGGNSDPNTAGNQKATSEFLPLMNLYYRQWQEFLNP